VEASQAIVEAECRGCFSVRPISDGVRISNEYAVLIALDLLTGSGQSDSSSDFESAASANSAIPAWMVDLQIISRR
jgi:hypothetical protein